MSRNFLFSLAILFVLQTSLAPDSFANSVKVISNQDFMILYSLSGDQVEFENDKGKKERWVELHYKLVNRSNSPEKYFADSGWAAVQFQDDEKFVVAYDLIEWINIQRRADYFGVVWLTKDRVKKIHDANLASIPAERLQTVWRERDSRMQPVELAISEFEAREAELPEEASKKEKRFRWNPFSKKSEKSLTTRLRVNEYPEQFDADQRRTDQAPIPNPIIEKLVESTSVGWEEETNSSNTLEVEESETVTGEVPAESPYEDTVAGFTLDSSDDRLDETDVTAQLAEFEAEPGMSPAEADNPDAIDNDQIKQALDEFYQNPPTIE